MSTKRISTDSSKWVKKAVIILSKIKTDGREPGTQEFRYVYAAHWLFYEWLIPDGDRMQEHTFRYGI